MQSSIVLLLGSLVMLSLASAQDFSVSQNAGSSQFDTEDDWICPDGYDCASSDYVYSDDGDSTYSSSDSNSNNNNIYSSSKNTYSTSNISSNSRTNSNTDMGTYTYNYNYYNEDGSRRTDAEGAGKAPSSGGQKVGSTSGSSSTSGSDSGSGSGGLLGNFGLSAGFSGDAGAGGRGEGSGRRRSGGLGDILRVPGDVAAGFVNEAIDIPSRFLGGSGLGGVLGGRGSGSASGRGSGSARLTGGFL